MNLTTRRGFFEKKVVGTEVSRHARVKPLAYTLQSLSQTLKKARLIWKRFQPFKWESFLFAEFSIKFSSTQIGEIKD